MKGRDDVSELPRYCTAQSQSLIALAETSGEKEALIGAFLFIVIYLVRKKD